MLGSQQPQADTHHNHQEPEFEIRFAPHKTVPRPKLLRYRHCDQFNGNQQQQQTAQPQARLY